MRFGDGVQQPVAHAEIREPEEGNDGGDGHPQAVALHAQIMNGEANGDEGHTDGNRLGHDRGEGGQSGAAVTLPRTALFRRSIERFQPQQALETPNAFNDAANVENIGKSAPTRQFGRDTLHHRNRGRFGDGQQIISLPIS